MLISRHPTPLPLFSKIFTLFVKDPEILCRLARRFGVLEGTCALFGNAPVTISGGRSVVVEERVNGRLYIRSGARFVGYKVIERRPEALKELKPWSPAWVPPKEHPWRRPFLTRREAARGSLALVST